jgi:transposase
MLSTVSGTGQMRFMVTGKTCTIPVFLIVDGHPVHRSEKVKAYVESTKEKLKLFYPPGYSPELNPDETVWSYVKHHVVGKKIITGPERFLKGSKSGAIFIIT